jgi:hypothetical protein
MVQRMYGLQVYDLVGPFDNEMRFSTDVTRMPTLNMTPEITAAPEFRSKRIRLVIKDGNTQFTIGEERQVSLVCLTGDPEENDFVFAFKNSSFEEPVLATLTYTNQEGERRRAEFELDEWSDDFTFSGTISIPEDAARGEATLRVNFSEMDADGRRPLHFPQIARTGWRLDIELSR